MIKATADGVQLTVRVIPRARKTQCSGVRDEALVVRVAAPPVEGAANDAQGGAVVPGFVDPHTHVVFAGDRREELRRRLTGTTYAQIAAEGGGILGTVVATRAASGDQLASDTRRRLDEMLRCGITTCEV